MPLKSLTRRSTRLSLPALVSQPGVIVPGIMILQDATTVSLVAVSHAVPFVSASTQTGTLPVRTAVVWIRLGVDGVFSREAGLRERLMV
jgi:hypothetical protein